jgi:hypothetical protein
METVYLWEKIVYVAAIVSIVGPTTVCAMAFIWIKNNYFSDKKSS